MPDLDAFRRMLADCEASVGVSPSEAQWALDIPVPLMVEDVEEDVLEGQPELRDRFYRVVAALEAEVASEGAA